MTSLAPVPSRPPKGLACPRPLMPLSAVMWRLDRDEDAILRLIEDGELSWAFNVARPSAREHRSPRVLTESVTDYLNGRTRSFISAEAEWQWVISMILPAGRTAITCDLARALCCGREHIMNLLREGAIKAEFPEVRRGMNSSPRFYTQSVADWLRGRRLQ